MPTPSTTRKNKSATPTRAAKTTTPATKPTSPQQPPRPKLSARRRAFYRKNAKRNIAEYGNVAERTRARIERERKQGPQLPLTNELWLSLSQIEKRTGLNPRTLRYWTRTGELRYRRFGRTIRIPLSELERFSSGRSNTAA